MPEQTAIQSDDELMRLVCSGDEGAFARMMERHRGAVLRLLHRSVSRREVAEELLQDVFMKLYRARQAYDGGERLRPYLFQIARRTLTDYWRKVRPGSNVPTDAPGKFGDPEFAGIAAPESDPPSKQIGRREIVARLRQAVEMMPDSLRACMVLFHFERMSVDEIAARLGILAGAVKKRLYDGRKWLLGTLQEEAA